MNVATRRRLEAVEMMCLWAMYGVNIMQIICSLAIRRSEVTVGILLRAEEVWTQRMEQKLDDLEGL